MSLLVEHHVLVDDKVDRRGDHTGDSGGDENSVTEVAGHYVSRKDGENRQIKQRAANRREDKREEAAENEQVNLDRVNDGVEVGTAVLIYVDGVNRNFIDLNLVLAAFDEHIHLILKPFTEDFEHSWDDFEWNSAQSRLGVHQLLSEHHGEHARRHLVAKGRARGNIRRVEVAGAENETVVVPDQLLGHADRVLQTMLSVGVAGDNANAVGVILQNIFHAGL